MHPTLAPRSRDGWPCFDLPGFRYRSDERGFDVSWPNWTWHRWLGRLLVSLTIANRISGLNLPCLRGKGAKTPPSLLSDEGHLPVAFAVSGGRNAGLLQVLRPGRP